MSVVHVERITCDNPECTAYVDELVRESPGQFELQEYVRSQIASQGWTYDGTLDFCALHSVRPSA